jgi:hypothetical protein
MAAIHTTANIWNLCYCVWKSYDSTFRHLLKLFQFMLAICWDCRYANPARNNPNITATNLITFFKAYPIRTPKKKPPPRVAAVGAKLSIMIISFDAAP